MYLFPNSVYKYEIAANSNIQKQFEFAEPALRIISNYFDPTFVLEFWIPLFGAFNQQLLLQLTTSIGLLNAATSIIKWTFPEIRPIWWVQENAFAHYSLGLREVSVDSYSCDTSAGLPSTHGVIFTTFALIVVDRIVNWFRSTSLDKTLIVYAIVFLMSTFMCLARLYFLYEFLHQCVIGSLFAVFMMVILEKNSRRLFSLGKVRSFLMVFTMGLLPVNIYFLMRYYDMDPFWSTRMAFKWCNDPSFLKHETTTVFILCRDLGYLVGISLSCPLSKSYDKEANNYWKRIPLLAFLEVVNTIGRRNTPKLYGRIIFFLYEFLRNCLHSFMLLKVLPMFDTK